MAHAPDLLRRRLVAALAAAPLTAWAGAPEPGPRRPVRVLTSYPDEVVSRFEAAFEAAHPEYRLRVDWRMPRDALPYLRAPGQNGVDAYWAASPRTFALLAREGRLQALGIDATGLPDRIGNTVLADPDGRYRATEMAGFGFVVNDAALKSAGLPAPADWADLADPRYAGRIALPDPARVGFAPPMVEIVLQGLGWTEGWALWSGIAGNAAVIGRGAPLLTDEVASGRLAVGPTIDFFAVAAIANGARLRFIHPRHGGLNPAHVAITAEAKEPEGARAFAAFVLSEAGQRLLTDREIRKLPVRPSVYAGLAADHHDPFAAARAGAYDYDGEAAAARIGVTTALFHQMLMADHAEHAALWRRVHAAEAAGRPVAAARVALATPPLTEEQAADPALRALFRERLAGNADAPVGTREPAWRAFAAARRAEAAAVLKEAGA